VKDLEEEEIEIQPKSIIQNGNSDQYKPRLKTNLEILLSQNDILPLLKKISKDKRRNENNLSLANYLSKSVIFILI